MLSSDFITVLSVGVNTASTPSVTSACAASAISSTVVPVRSMYSTPFSVRYCFAASMALVAESCPTSYRSPIFFASGFWAKISSWLFGE